MRFPFLKLDGAGNDFVALDQRDLPPLCDEEEIRLTRILCNRHHGIGADGILIVKPPLDPINTYRMTYRNADGSNGGMCGNGARCLVRAAMRYGWSDKQVRVETDAGIYEASIDGDTIHISFPPIDHLPKSLRLAEGTITTDFTTVGVPHAVVFSANADSINLSQIGPKIRSAAEFGPPGANANVVSLKGDGSLRVRTWERGVEGETLACGTGSVASAYCHFRRIGALGQQTIFIATTSGVRLSVSMVLTERGAREIILSGPAVVRFSGEIDVDLGAGEIFG